MKVWVAIWHHKHGTNTEAATTEKLAKQVMAERVLDAMDYQKTREQDAAHGAFNQEAYDGVFTLWKRYEAPEDSFEFLETDVYGVRP